MPILIFIIIIIPLELRLILENLGSLNLFSLNPLTSLESLQTTKPPVFTPMTLGKEIISNLLPGFGKKRLCVKDAIYRVL